MVRGGQERSRGDRSSRNGKEETATDGSKGKKRNRMNVQKPKPSSTKGKKYNRQEREELMIGST